MKAENEIKLNQLTSGDLLRDNSRAVGFSSSCLRINEASFSLIDLSCA